MVVIYYNLLFCRFCFAYQCFLNDVFLDVRREDEYNKDKKYGQQSLSR